MQSSFDRRRINGPEESHPPVFESDDEDKQAGPSDTRKRRTPHAIRPICTSFIPLLRDNLFVISNSFENRLNQPSQRLCIYRNGEDEDYMRCVSMYSHPTRLLSHRSPKRYGPRQSKSGTYSEKGRLNVEVKFAPFSCTRRRIPIRVRVIFSRVFVMSN